VHWKDNTKGKSDNSFALKIPIAVQSRESSNPYQDEKIIILAFLFKCWQMNHTWLFSTIHVNALMTAH